MIPASVGMAHARAASQLSSLPPLTPREEEDFLHSMGSKTVSGLSAVGNLLDLPGSMLRDTLSTLTGNYNNPFDQLLSPFSGDNRTSGRDLLENWGVLDPNMPGLDFGDVLGFGLEVGADPLSYLTMPLGAMGKGGQLLERTGHLDDLLKNADLFKGMGRREGLMRTTLRQAEPYLKAIPGGLETAQDAARGMGYASFDSALAQMGDKPLGGLLGAQVPFMEPFTTLGHGHLSQKAARGLDKVGDWAKYGNPVGRLFNQAFDYDVRGLGGEHGQRTLGPAVTDIGGEASVKGKEMWAPAIKALDDITKDLPTPDDKLEVGDLVAAAIEDPEDFPLHGKLREQMQPFVEQAIAHGKERLASEQWTGLTTKALDDITNNYLPHRLHVIDPSKKRGSGGSGGMVLSAKHSSQIQRHKFLKGLKGGRRLINELSMDPELSGVAHFLPPKVLESKDVGNGLGWLDNQVQVLLDKMRTMGIDKPARKTLRNLQDQIESGFTPSATPELLDALRRNAVPEEFIQQNLGDPLKLVDKLDRQARRTSNLTHEHTKDLAHWLAHLDPLYARLEGEDMLRTVPGVSEVGRVPVFPHNPFQMLAMREEIGQKAEGLVDLAIYEIANHGTTNRHAAKPGAVKVSDLASQLGADPQRFVDRIHEEFKGRAAGVERKGIQAFRQYQSGLKSAHEATKAEFGRLSERLDEMTQQVRNERAIKMGYEPAELEAAIDEVYKAKMAAWSDPTQQAIRDWRQKFVRLAGLAKNRDVDEASVSAVFDVIADSLRHSAPEAVGNMSTGQIFELLKQTDPKPVRNSHEILNQADEMLRKMKGIGEQGGGGWGDEAADISFEPPVNPTKLYRGEAGTLPSGKHLAGLDENARLREITGMPADPNAPQLEHGFKFYSESPDVAKKYANRDLDLLEEYKKNYNIKDPEASFEILHGHKPRGPGKVIEENLHIQNPLDIHHLGETVSYNDLMESLLKAEGSPLPKKGWTWADIDTDPAVKRWSELDQELGISDLFGEHDKIKTWALNRSDHTMPNRATKLKEWMKANGYDAMAFAEDGSKNWAVIEDSVRKTGDIANTADDMDLADILKHPDLGPEYEKVKSRMDELAQPVGEHGHANKYSDLAREAAVDIERQLDDVWVDKEFAEELSQVAENFRSPKFVETFFEKGWDYINRLWQSHVTRLFPSFHFRNSAGGQAANKVAGAFGWRDFYDSARLVRGESTSSYKSIPRYRGMTEEAARTKLAIDLFAHDVFTKEQGVGLEGMEKSLVNQDLASAIPGQRPLTIGGMLSKAIPSRAKGTLAQQLNPLNLQNSLLEAGADASAFVEATNRITAFTSLLRKGYSPKKAAEKVRAIHGDYKRLTPVEKKYFRRMIPFYTFSKTMAKWTFDELSKRPGGMLAQFGIRAPNQAREQGQPLPDYLSQTAAIPLGKLPSGADRYLTGFGMSWEDPLSFLNVRNGLPDLTDMGSELVSRMSPMIKAPLEAITGESFFQRGPLGGRELLEMDPTMGRLLSNIGLGKEGSTGRAEPVGSQQFENIVANTPLARYLTTARTLTDPRKLEGGAFPGSMLGLQLGTGLHVSDLSPRARDAILRDETTAEMQALGAKTWKETTFTKAQVQEALAEDPDLALQMVKYNRLQRYLQGRGKKEKKASAGRR